MTRNKRTEWQREWDRDYAAHIRGKHFPQHQFVKTTHCNACNNCRRRINYALKKGKLISMDKKCYICEAACKVTVISLSDGFERMTVFCPIHGMIETRLSQQSDSKKKGGDIDGNHRYRPE